MTTNQRSAIDGLQELIDSIGHGNLEGKLVVNQAYAQAQHEELTWKHPHGGRAKYLQHPLYENSGHLVRILADSLLAHLEHSNIVEGMIKVSETMSGYVEENAPKDVGMHELAYSGHPMVYDDGVLVYDRAPKVPRVSN